MKSILKGSAAALSLALCAAPALAQDTAADNTVMAVDEIVALGFRPDAHGPAGTMADHVHKSGDVMVALSWMHDSHGGTNRRGTAPISDAAIVAAGYTAKTTAMTMDMAMLHVMWAPSDRVTLMLVPSWMRMDMTMEGIAPGVAHGGHHALAVGETMRHTAQGIGDTQLGALVSLSRRPALSLHAGLMVSAPTGDARRKDEDGNYLHYMMQGGSGTWDLNPSLTAHGLAGGIGWGAQVAYLFRAEKKNAAGFRFGDRFTATTWLSAPVTPRLSLSARAAWSSEGKVEGHYNSGHNHAAPADRQANYGGQKLEAGLGANVMLGDRLRLGLEANVPVYQDLHGIQLPKRWGASAGIGVMF
ncbi:hypothetical protein ACFFF7_05390 [Novosphingobium aquiterrae]|uniref:Transporter n=1 Tax=Novosphingobium aquiterrae TaxID=624388 RepID=A0ABV6PG86_9SPHN